MAERTTSIGLMVEYSPTSNRLHTTSVGLMIEWMNPLDMCRASAVGLMVEYAGEPEPPAKPSGAYWFWL